MRSPFADAISSKQAVATPRQNRDAEETEPISPSARTGPDEAGGFARHTFCAVTLNIALASLPPQRVCGNPRLPFVFQGAVQDRIGARDNRRARTNNA